MQEISNPPLIVYFIYKGNNRQISGRLFGDTMFHYDLFIMYMIIMAGAIFAGYLDFLAEAEHT
jgi:hypothetical protein